VITDSIGKEPKLAEVLAAAMKLYASGIKYIIPLCLLVYIPVNIIELFTPQAISVAALLENPVGIVESGLYDDFMLYFYITQGLRIVFGSIVAGGMTYIAASRLSPMPSALTSAGLLDYSLARWARLAYTGILCAVIVSMSLALIVPAIYFGVSFMFHLNITALSGERGLKALIGSAKMIKGRFLRSFLYFLVFQLISLGASALLMYLIPIFWPGYAFFSSAESSFLEKALYVLLNASVETISSFSIMAQAVWFIKLILNYRKPGVEKII
jgi:hypothetical protein